jgi:hypothetical protein
MYGNNLESTISPKCFSRTDTSLKVYETLTFSLTIVVFPHKLSISLS